MHAHPIDPGFHIANAQEVALAYDGESLVMSFLDWREQARARGIRRDGGFALATGRRGPARRVRDGTSLVGQLGPCGRHPGA